MSQAALGIHRGRLARALVMFALLGSPGAAPAVQVYLAPEAFIAQAFAGSPPPPAMLWLTGARREAAQTILGHAPPARLRYWRQGRRSAWILEEVGKEEPITVGLVVEDGALVGLQVLIYRESRGWEVRLPAFIRQFEGAHLDAERRLDRRIDNISGATLSVNALKRVARLALFLAGELEP